MLTPALQLFPETSPRPFGHCEPIKIHFLHGIEIDNKKRYIPTHFELTSVRFQSVVLLLSEDLIPFHHSTDRHKQEVRQRDTSVSFTELLFLYSI